MTVRELVSDARHAGAVRQLSRVGEASAEPGLFVRIGISVRSDGTVERARFQATTCVALVAYAEAACTLLERGVDPARLDADALRGAVTGVHPIHHARAELVARAVRSSARPGQPQGGVS